MQKDIPVPNRSTALTDLLIIFIPFGILIVARESINNDTLSTLGRALLIALTVWLVFRRGGGWQTVGLKRPESVIKTLLLGIALMVIGIFVAGAAQEFLLALSGITFAEADLSRFADIVGNLPRLLMHLLIVWTTVAFGEELVWRAFLTDRLETIFGVGRYQDAMVVLIGALMFGLAHYYQGLLGILVTGLLGLVYMIAYRLTGRNLWILIIGHGLFDTLTFLTIYSGRL